MFDFEGSNWDVDTTAEKLNTSLFGSAKKRKLQKAKAPSQQNGQQAASAVIPDSDDETFTKKGKRKLKERNRKLKKPQKELNDEDGSGSVDMDEVLEAGDMAHGKQKNKKVQSEVSGVVKTGKKKKGKKESSSDLNAGTVAKKVKATTNDQDGVSVQKKGKKRKLTDAEKIEEKQVTKKQKQAEKVDGTGDGSVSANTAEKPKRKRNRKKKNNSKKNKYLHLALNKKEKSAENSSTQDHSQDDSKPSVEAITSPSGSSKGTDLTQEKAMIPKEKKKKNLKNKPNLQTENVTVNSKQTPPMNEKKKKNPQQKQSLPNVNKQSLPNMNKQSLPNENMQNLPKEKKQSLPKENGKEKGQTMSKKMSKKLKSQPTVAPETPQNQNLQKDNEKDLSPQKSKTPDSRVKYKTNILTKMLNDSSILSSPSAELTPSPKRKDLSEFAEDEDISTASQLGKKKKRKNGSSMTNNETVPKNLENKSESKSKTPVFPNASIWGKAAALTQQARDTLDSARFRYINEQLYSCKGVEALQMFRSDRDAFNVYHGGYRNQVSKWEVNPLTVIIKQLNNKSDALVVADFGCGEAKLAESVPQKVHSFDLVALNKRVTACDMSHTPLQSETVDVAVFCLSLMGTNLNDYLREANRVLKTGGILKLAEVTSRFSGLSQFINGVTSQGFLLLNKRDLTQMFYLMDFKKVKTVKKSPPGAELKLKPCIYKRR